RHAGRSVPATNGPGPPMSSAAASVTLPASRGAALRWPAAVTLVVVVLAVVPPVAGGYLISRLTGYLIFGLLALSVALITGYGRLFNVGVGAIFGVSAYTIAVLTQQGIVNPVLLLLSALAAGVLVSLLFGFYALVATGV